MVGAAAASLAVAGCAVVAVGMSSADPARVADRTSSAMPTGSALRPVTLPMTSAARGSSAASSSTGPAPSRARSSTVAPTFPAATSARPAARRSSSPAGVPAPRTARRAAPTSSASAPRAQPVAPRGQALPLRYSAGTATRVITVTARSTQSTVATLQAWTKATGGGWLRYGSAVTAHVGSDGLSSSPSEFRSATPIGSFTLTQGFGYYANPGTSLHYFRTNSADWWISEPGALYNTHQHCWSGCPFTRGDPNEHLYYERPFYNYAVVINTPSGAAAYPHGSAFFLHVTDGNPTAGCVAISQSKLVSLMRWLTPSAHPRILIGVG
jgi:L,D-peptidoglycan transpeptidase YkuD (ErfK/YbiS/YcfS/YnhG family)